MEIVIQTTKTHKCFTASKWLFFVCVIYAAAVISYEKRMLWMKMRPSQQQSGTTYHQTLTVQSQDSSNSSILSAQQQQQQQQQQHNNTTSGLTTNGLEQYSDVHTTTRNISLAQLNPPSTAMVSTPSEKFFLVPNETDYLVLQRLNKSISLLPEELSPLTNCNPTTQLRLCVRGSEWILQSLDSTGNNKTVGGDEFYIKYWDYGDERIDSGVIDPPAVAVTEDRGDGSYRLDWVTPTMLFMHPEKAVKQKGIGRVTIFLQYTCGIGKMERPTKKKWKNGGMIRQAYTIENIAAPLHVRGPKAAAVDLSHYGNVICFGDSIIGNLCGKWWNKFMYEKPNISLKKKVGSETALETLSALMEKLATWHGEMLSSSPSPNATALLLGSAVWDILEPTRPNPIDPGFHNHLEACRQLITSIQKEYPNVTIVWKLPQAFHVEVLKKSCISDEGCRERTKYMSSSLVYTLYQKQTQLMKELNIPVLDYYEATYVSGAWMMDGDGRHYRKWLNKNLIDLSYGVSINNQQQVQQ